MEPSTKAMAQELEEVKREVTGLRVELKDMRELVENQICTYCGRHMSEHEFNEEFKKSVEKAKREIKEGKCTVCNTKKESDKFFAEL